MRNFFILATVVVFANCSNNKESKIDYNATRSQIIDSFARTIDSLKVKDLYDTAKWWTYCINCDDTVKFDPYDLKRDTTVTFGALDLRCCGIQLRGNDTLDIAFKFYMDTIPGHFNDKDIANASLGLQFKLSTRKVIAVINYSSLKYAGIHKENLQNGNRYDFPLQPGVTKYIINNKSNLNRWFFDEATRRKII